MEKFALDYNSLVTKIDRPKEYRLADVKDRIERVAFDVVRFRDNEDTDQLWRIDERDDGPVIVALYEDNPSEMTTESATERKWEALPDKKAGCLHLYYKGDPIVRLAASDVGLPESELEVMARWLPDRLEEDDRLRQLVLDKSNDSELTRKYPELKSTAANLRTMKIAEQIRTAGEEEALGKAEGDSPISVIRDVPVEEEIAADPEVEEYRQKINDTLAAHLQAIQNNIGPTQMFEVGVAEHLKDPFVDKMGEPVEMTMQLAASLILRAADAEMFVDEMRNALLRDIESTNRKIEPLGKMVDPDFTSKIETLSVDDVVKNQEEIT